MKCPSCSMELKMSDRQGVEIDYCPGCRGVWLDRGELDKIIERSAIDDRQNRDEDDDDYPRDSDNRAAPRRKRRSWLGEMFEFGD